MTKSHGLKVENRNGVFHKRLMLTWYVYIYENTVHLSLKCHFRHFSSKGSE